MIDAMTVAQSGSAHDSLDDLLTRARDADPEVRIELRDQIASHGEAAIDAMTDWLGDHRLAGFAIRVLERIGLQPVASAAAIDVLVAIDRDDLPPPLAGDVDRALSALGRPKTAARGPSRTPRADRPSGRPGVLGRGYWVMRTSPWERPYIWAEALRGRLRQGWGWNAEMDLDVIEEAVRRRRSLSDEQQAAIRSRRMNTAAPDGMREGDTVVAPNLPEWGQLSIFRVMGSYVYSLDAPRRFNERFGHILPVELLSGSIDRRAPIVSDGLRAMLRPQTRLYNISGYGGDVESVLGREPRSEADRSGDAWTDRDYETLFGRFPPTQDRPSEDAVAALAAELGRTFDAISWQWSDGASYCAGRSASTTSEALNIWLDQTHACDG
jgi:hypothetical protein